MLEGAGGEFGNKLLQDVSLYCLKNQGMDVRVYSLALLLNVLFVMPSNCEQITFES